MGLWELVKQRTGGVHVECRGLGEQGWPSGGKGGCKRGAARRSGACGKRQADVRPADVRAKSPVLPRAAGLDENTGTFLREGSGLGFGGSPQGYMKLSNIIEGCVFNGHVLLDMSYTRIWSWFKMRPE